METRYVYGFLEAGKTTYIQKAVTEDIFYKFGKTLVLCFEAGEVEYDERALSERNARVAYYDGREEIESFCEKNLNLYHPDRVYIEMNIMLEGLREKLPPVLKPSFTITLLDANTLELFLTNLKALVGEMVRASSTVTFRSASSKELLAPYGQTFRMMNPKTLYLRQDPMGYHEKAFDAFLPYRLEEPLLSIGEKEYIAFSLDAVEHPEHYAGKELVFTLPLEVQRNGEGKELLCGRTVMTCCMADLQFLSRPLKEEGKEKPLRGWIHLKAKGHVATERFGIKRLYLIPLEVVPCPPPKELIMGVS